MQSPGQGRQTNSASLVRELAQTFSSALLAAGSVGLQPVVQMPNGDVFIHLLPTPGGGGGGSGGVRLVAVTRQNVFQCLVLELLHEVAGLVREYCGSVTEEAIRANR